MEVNAISEDINMDEPRGRSLSSSPNEHRLIQIPYVDRMEAQNNDPSWFNQTEQEYFQLSYATPKEGVPNVQNEANNSSNTPLHMWRIQITTMSTWINLMGLIRLLFYMRKHDQPMMIHGVVNPQSPYLEPRRQFLRI